MGGLDKGAIMVRVLLVGDFVRLNLSANVGRGQPNKIDDVELVRFGYYCARASAVPPAFAKTMRVELMALKTKGAYGADLEKVIIGHQKLRGGTQDGYISPEKPGFAGERYDGKTTWMITALNNNILDVCKEIWPRLDKHEIAGLELSKRLRYIFLNEQ